MIEAFNKTFHIENGEEITNALKEAFGTQFGFADWNLAEFHALPGGIVEVKGIDYNDKGEIDVIHNKTIYEAVIGDTLIELFGERFGFADCALQEFYYVVSAPATIYLDGRAKLEVKGYRE